MAFVFKYCDINVAMGIKAILLTLLGYSIGFVYPLSLVVLIVIYLVVVIHNGKALWR